MITVIIIATRMFTELYIKLRTVTKFDKTMAQKTFLEYQCFLKSGKFTCERNLALRKEVSPCSI